ncbi:cyanoexosortase B [Cyanobacteria bacterium FACHB-DQ100]|uniref:cyanoexosortase B n=1 Tax=Leptolyngbya sp. DQ-M1 TaxID=2933920 RepID=UPI00198B6053|nr:cyanoexosortase B [Cyanobacteria bacterium FACHB-DQ100]
MQIRRLSFLDRYWSDIVLLGLIAALYAPLLVHWYDGWIRKSISTEHEYFSHGVIGLPFAANIAWYNRKRWIRLADEVGSARLVGLGLLLVAGLFYLSGLPEPVNLSFPILLTGVCLWLKGVSGLRLQAFALLLVFLATPNEIPYLLAPYTMPLQSFIAGTAGFILNQFGMAVRVENIYLFVNNRLVEVAPYCAGLKMLFTSLYVGLMLLYWTNNLRSRSFCITFMIGTVLISVTANIIRNTLLTFFHGTGQESAFHFLHDGWGGDVYSAAMLGLLIVLSNQMEKFFAPSSPES